MLKVVVSGVNLVEGGILSILHDTLKSFSNLKKTYDLEITVLVHDKKLVSDHLNEAGFSFVQFPEIKSSWFKRINFEYFESKNISNQIKPDMWLSLHDMTPNVTCNYQLVYCHNASPFYKFDIKKFFYDRTFSLFCIFYRYLYQINIKKNKYVIVQQNWIRNAFEKMYGVNTIVAYPVHSNKSINIENENLDYLNIDFEKTTFFYPSFPRVFKNFEILCMAAQKLETTTANFEVIVTMNGVENIYAKKVFDQFKHVKSIKFIGIQKRNIIEQLYEKVDCMVFPSKLESWGLPISEFKNYDKPILLADLPYAHENIGSYSKAKFFNNADAGQLASYMEMIIKNKLTFDKNTVINPQFPFFDDWDNLLIFLLEEAKAKKNTI